MKFRELNNSINQGTKVYGVTLAFKNQINGYLKNRFGVSLFGEIEKCKINGIALEWVQITKDERSGSVKTHSLEDRNNTLISSNVINGNRLYGIKVILTEYGTKNPKMIYEEIVELWQKKRLCKISTTETIEDIVITRVSREYTTETTFEFSLDFEVIEFAYLMKKGEILSENRTILKETEQTGLCGTRTSNIKWGGFL